MAARISFSFGGLLLRSCCSPARAGPAPAIAIATVNTPGLADQLQKKEGPAVHKDVSEQTQHPGTPNQQG